MITTMNMWTVLVASFVICFAQTTNALDGGSSYFLTKPQEVCQMTTNMGSTIDLVCRVIDQDVNATCDSKTMRWVRNRRQLTKNEKYGIWTAEWGVKKNEHVSLLRVHSVSIEDVGAYICDITCQKQNRSPQSMSTTIQLCMRDKDTVVCRPSTKTCQNEFMDGKCDQECNNPQGLYDGFDCLNKPKMCTNEHICRSTFANGICSGRGCDSINCAFDGGDCVLEQSDKFSGTIVIESSQDRDTLEIDMKPFLWHLSRLLRTPVIAETYKNVINDTDTSIAAIAHRLDNALKYIIQPAANDIPLEYYWNTKSKNLVKGSVAYLRLNNAQCASNCLHDADMAAQFMANAIQKGWDPGIPLLSIGVVKNKVPCSKEKGSLLDNVPTENVVSTVPPKHKGENFLQTIFGPGPLDLGLVIGASLGGLAFLLLVVGCCCIFCCRSRRSLEPREPEKLPKIHQPENIIVENEHKKKQWAVTVNVGSNAGTKC